MPNWKKIITSGSNASLSSLYAPSITGSLLGTASYSIYAETASYSNSTTQIDVYVLNQSGASIAKGVVVRITGSNNASDIPRIVTASYENDNNSANTLGITTQTIANGDLGYVITEGVLTGVDTQTFISGQLIYLGATGSIIGYAPVAPLHAVRLGEVIRQQSNNGSIYVRIDNGYELNEIHDVYINTASVTYGDLLIRSSSVWINSKQLTGSYAITGSLTATSFTGSLFGTSSWASNAITSQTASYILNAVSASFATLAQTANTASYVVTAQTASYVLQAVSASFATSASKAISSSFATTASYATQAISASYAPDTTFPYVGSARISGSLGITGSFEATSSLGLLRNSGFVDNTGASSIKFANRLLTDSANNDAVDWENRRALDSTAVHSILWDSRLLKIGGTPAAFTVDWGNGTLRDLSSVNSVDWVTRYMNDTFGNVSIDWENRTAYDSATSASINWRNRELNDNNQQSVISWGGVSGEFSTYKYNAQRIGAATRTALYTYNKPGGQFLDESYFDVNVVDNDLVFLETDGLWYQVDQATDSSTKMLGIAKDISSQTGSIITEGDLVVTTATGYPYVTGAGYGLPVYIREGTGTQMATVAPATGYVRLLGHCYYNDGSSTEWIMKFRPSHEWVSI